MKICMISGANRDEPYGSTIRPTYLAKGLATRGLEIFHFAPKHSSVGDKIPGLSNYDLLEVSLKRRFEIIHEVLGHSPPDVIYTHQIESAKLGLMLSFSLRKPHVYDAHSSVALEAPTYRNFPGDIRRRQFVYERLIVKLSSMIIVPSIELKGYLKNKYRLNPDKIAIVKNGVDRSQFFPGQSDKLLRKTLNLDDAYLVVFTNPRLPTFPSNDLALQYLFDMIPEIEEKVPRVKFLILGGGAQPNGPSDNVIYTGYVDDLSSYINIADICVAPFPPEAVCGGTRTKICEFLACGKPVIATPEGMRGFDDALPGKHFILAKSTKDFMRYVVECFDSPEKGKCVGQNARALSERYDWEHLSRDLERHLRGAASS